MVKLRSITFAALLLAALGTASADTLNTSGASATMGSMGPTRGMNQATVQSQYGSPVSVEAPVGDPPITRWVYKDFIVYFEYDLVIHSVAKR